MSLRDRYCKILDVVERTRAWCLELSVPPPAEWLHEACDEIERLRAERDTASHQAELNYQDEIDRLRLTDAEWYAISAGLLSLELALCADRENCGGKYRDMEEDAATLRQLLSRLAPLSGAGQSQDSEK